MTQEEALTEFKKLLPEKAERLQAEWRHAIGDREYGIPDTYTLWDWSRFVDLKMWSSDKSWEEALGKVEASCTQKTQ
jgi:hypothetical protein